jgi:acetyl esterase/lipase
MTSACSGTPPPRGTIIADPRSAAVTHPPLDPELGPALERISKGIPASLTVDLIPAVRQAAGQFAPGETALRRDGAVSIVDVLATSPADQHQIPLLVCRPAEGQGVPEASALPAIYYIHGGGMVMGDNRTGIETVLDWVCELGVVAVSVDYRLAPEHRHPIPVSDCYAGLLWTAEHAAELGIDPDRIVIAGGSAGGGLAAAVTLMARDRGAPSLIGQVLMSPMLDDRSDRPSTHELHGEGIWDRTSNLTGWSALLGEARGGADVSPYAAPARADDLSGLPPAYIDVGSVETFRDENIDYATRLWHAGGSAEFHVWAGGFHGFDLLVPGAAVSRASVETRIGWLRRILANAI